LGAGLKKWVVRPRIDLSMGERITRNCFLKVINYNYKDLRLPVRPVAEAQKGSGAAEGLLSREGAHFLGWDKHVGNEGL
jgi:hypothetical protein